MLVITRTPTNNTYNTAKNGTITRLTLAILLTPPIRTRATHTASTREAITTDHEYSPKNGIFTQCELSASKKPLTALDITFA